MPFGLDDRLKRDVDHLEGLAWRLFCRAVRTHSSSRQRFVLWLLIAILQSTCSMAASADSAPVSPSAQATQTGGSYTTTFSSSSGFSGTFLFDVELWTTAGTRAFYNWKTHTLTGQTTVSVTRTIPADVSGSLIAKAGNLLNGLVDEVPLVRQHREVSRLPAACVYGHSLSTQSRQLSAVYKASRQYPARCCSMSSSGPAPAGHTSTSLQARWMPRSLSSLTNSCLLGLLSEPIP